jgi:lipopolysaccharide transport system ATP-binding protein
MDARQIEAAIQDIAEFTELGQFLAQPFKTYSAGMQARLTFATATVLNPNILIVDEILGAGDAYFASKSMERMKRLVEDSGATVLIVSHALDQILRYCEEVIWLERGRIVKRGPALEVIKAYEQFVRILEDRRIKAKNYKRVSNQYGAEQYDMFGDNLTIRMVWDGKPGSHCDISSLKLIKNGDVEDEIRIGDTQDFSPSHSGSVILNGSAWSESKREGKRYFRRLSINPIKYGAKNAIPESPVIGYAIFYLYALFQNAEYALQMEYRGSGSGQFSLEFWKDGNLQAKNELPADAGNWSLQTVPLEFLNTIAPQEANIVVDGTEDAQALQDGVRLSYPAPENNSGGRIQRRWPSSEAILIEKVRITDSEGKERAVFSVNDTLNLSIAIKAQRKGHFAIVLATPIYRLDGILVAKFRMKPFPVDVAEGSEMTFNLKIDHLNLGNGNYVFSVGLFDNVINESTRMDLIDRSFEFQVVGNDEYYSQVIFHHPGTWSIPGKS